MATRDREDVVEGLTSILRAVAAERRTITYQELLDRVGDQLPPDGPTSLPALLREVSTREVARGRPMLSAVVVRRTGLPGGGFFRLAAELGAGSDEPRAFWEEEVTRVYACYAGDPR